MADEVGNLSPTPEPVDEQPQQRRAWSGPFRSVVLPLLMLTAIGASIWFLEYRPGAEGGRSLTGATFGPVALPAVLMTANMAVAPEAGKLAPDFVLETLDGKEVRLSDLRGKAVIVNFWATWCLPCRREVPELVAAYDRYRERGLEVLAVNLQENPGLVTNFAREFGMEFPVLLDRNCGVTDAYRVTASCRVVGIPTSFFIDAQGVVRSVFLGPFVGQQSREGIATGELARRVEEILP